MQIRIPAELLPEDGRFGSGPSKVRHEAVERLAVVAPALLGTSHRQSRVSDQIRRVREGLREFFALPESYEVVLGNGGATLFFDAVVHCLIIRRSAHAVFGEFSAKFAATVQAAPFLDDPVIVESKVGTHPTLAAHDGVDLYAFTHCETSTGVVMPIKRPEGAVDALIAVDATSAAGGVMFDIAEVDAYFFSPQKGFGSEGGLFAALLSPAAIQRIATICTTDRHIPGMLDLSYALEYSMKNQTANTPSITTLFFMAEQIEWLNKQGGLTWAAQACAAKSTIIYHWAETRTWAAPFVTDPAMRSPVVCTIDLDPAISASEVSTVLRANGILDTEGYRRLGRNQLRIATFPAVAASDLERLTAAIDYVVEALT